MFDQKLDAIHCFGAVPCTPPDRTGAGGGRIIPPALTAAPPLARDSTGAAELSRWETGGVADAQAGCGVREHIQVWLEVPSSALSHSTRCSLPLLTTTALEKGTFARHHRLVRFPRCLESRASVLAP